MTNVILHGKPVCGSLLLSLMAGFAFAVEPPGLSTPIPLWKTGGMPCAATNAVEDHAAGPGSSMWTDVYVPRMYFYPAPGGRAKPCVIVCPGGAYRHLSYMNEGRNLCTWFNVHDVSAFLLLYRVGQAAINPDGALADAQQAIRIVRAQAAKYNVDPAKVGMMGFSAGANLTARTSCSAVRPDFAFVIYPYWMEAERNTAENHRFVPRDWFKADAHVPPTFIVQAEDDPCRVESALTWYIALKYAGVPVEMHLYPDGGHGYGIGRSRPPNRPRAVEGWEDLAWAWMQRVLMEKE